MRYWVIGLLMMVSLSACNSDEPDKPRADVPARVAVNSAVDVVSVAASSILDGVWQSCYRIGEKYVQYTTTQNSGSWQDTYFEYDDDQCTRPTAQARSYNNKGTYKLGKKIELEQFNDASLDVYNITIIENDAGRVHECYTLVGVGVDEMYYGVIDEKLDCTTLAARSITLDLTNKLERMSKDAAPLETLDVSMTGERPTLTETVAK